MDIDDLGLYGIEEAYNEKEKGYIPQEHVSILQQAIIKAQSISPLGISSGPQKENKRKHVEISKKLGRKLN